MCRICSPTVDLNYLLYSSMEGPTRTKFIDVLLSTYYSSFNTVLAGKDMTPIFTFEQLKTEYKNKHGFGLMLGLQLIPFMLVDQSEATDFNVENIEEFMAEQKVSGKRQMQTNPLFKPTLLYMIDEMLEKGVLKRN